MKRALIIGGGIGGLAAAIALRHAGCEVAVFERAPELREVGAGLVLAPNAVKALRHLGLRDAAEAAGAVVESGESRSWRGRPLIRAPLAEIARRAGAPTICIHRAELQALLAGALEGGVLHLGMTCTGFEHEGDGITACFDGGEAGRGDFLIGADGLHSVIRQQVPGMTPLRYAGYTAWRGVAAVGRAALGSTDSCETWGRGARFGFVRMSRDRVYWFATANVPEGNEDAPERRKEELLVRFSDWHTPIPRLVEATEASSILRNDVHDREPSRQWGTGRVTLLGDAAHPTTPNMGQGACQAIEDAVMIGRCVAAETDPTAALRAYEARRMERTRRIVEYSRRFGAIGQWSSPWACWARDTLAGITPPRFVVRQMAWVTEYEV